MINIIVCGIGGKVGTMLLNLTKNSNDLKIVGGIDKFANPKNFDIPIFETFDKCNISADVVIDFSRPEAINSILEYCLKTKTRLVLCTTGHTSAQQDAIDSASEKIAIFQSSNMSLGVNLLISLAKQAARFLGNNYDIEIVEYHHNQKVDSPSGTALSIAKGINNEFENSKNFVYGRHGTADKRVISDIGIHAVRGGTIVGRHDVMYIGTDEIVTIAHEAQSRQVFAHGALRACIFLMDYTVGMYDMNDIIGKDYSVTIVKGTPNVTLINLNDITMKQFNTLLAKIGEHSIILDMISQTISNIGKFNISFTFDSAELIKVTEVLKMLDLDYKVRENTAKLVIEGAGMEHQYGIASKALSALSDNDIEILAITTSDTNISVCINGDRLADATAIINNSFELTK